MVLNFDCYSACSSQKQCRIFQNVHISTQIYSQNYKQILDCQNIDLQYDSASIAGWCDTLIRLEIMGMDDMYYYVKYA